MNDSEIDMDEVEARLYGQVYHAPNNEDNLTLSELHTSTPKFTRYLENKHSFDSNQIPPHGNSKFTQKISRYFAYEQRSVYPISIVNPVNNIVVLPSRQAQTLAQQQDSEKWLGSLLDKLEKKRTKNKKSQRRKLKRKLQVHSSNSFSKSKTLSDDCEIIDISDVCTDVQQPIVISEDSVSHISDDVLIVETPNEVISVDSDETLEPLISFESKDGSNANDSVVSHKDNGKRISPIKNKDACEAGGSSTSSTIDYTENLKGVTGDKVSNEVHSNNTFSGLNLDTFTNYIQGDGASPQGVHSLSTLLNVAATKKSQKAQNDNSSDSSSESEYDGSDAELSYPLYNFDAEENVQEVSIENDNREIISSHHSETTDVITTPLTTNAADALNDDKEISVFKSNFIHVDASVDAQQEEEAEVLDDDDVICINDTLQPEVINLDDDEVLHDIDEDESSNNKSNTFRFMDYWTEDMNKSYTESWRGGNFRLIEQHRQMPENEVLQSTNEDKSSTSKTKTFMDYWTEDMKKFYTESWGGENFNLIEEQRRMSDDPSMWKIISRDRINLTCLAKERRCRRCREHGHIAVRCTKKLAPPKCILCGASGHYEARCPDKMCTSCGRYSNYFTTYCSGCTATRYVKCTICKMQSHVASSCPDLWRRYLFTTSEGPVQQPLSEIKQPKDRWCSGCGANGHFEQHCLYYYNRTHAPTSVFIHSFEDIYATDKQAATSTTSTTSTRKRKSDSLPSTSITPPDDNENRRLSSNAVVDDNDKQPSTSTNLEVNESEEATIVSVAKNDWWDLNIDLGKEGTLFLSRLAKKTNVLIHVKKTTSQNYCIVRGITENKLRAKSAFSRYCSAIELESGPIVDCASFCLDFTEQSLKHNLNCLKQVSVNWRRNAQKCYNIVMRVSELIGSAKTEESYEKMNCVLTRCYKKLNTIIIAKLEIGKKHMEILEERANDNDILAVSFEYVFNSDIILFPNYQELINKLPAEFDVKPRVAAQLKATAVLICKQCKWHTNLQRLLDLYWQLIIFNYSAKHIATFKNEVVSIFNFFKNENKQKEKKTKKRKILNKLGQLNKALKKFA